MIRYFHTAIINIIKKIPGKEKQILGVHKTGAQGSSPDPNKNLRV